MAVVVIVAATGIIAYNTQSKKLHLSNIALENVEALARGESGGSYGCGYAAYEWDQDWYEDTKHFTKCIQGCPEGEGTSPKYKQCD